MNCRICESKLHNRVVHLHKMPLTDEFVRPNEIDKQEYISDISIYKCSFCGIVQNPVDLDYFNYYKSYQYSSGYSYLAKNFMEAYAKTVINAFEKVNKRKPQSVLEIGSGDGCQLASFKNLGVSTLFGVEPSDSLGKSSVAVGAHIICDLFTSKMLHKIPKQVDLCISSYTFDHVRDPLDYLNAVGEVLVEGGIIAIEIHDLKKIVERTEYCLFEHEHTIYLDEDNVTELLVKTGFTPLCINPLQTKVTRGNSLIVIAKKSSREMSYSHQVINKVKRAKYDLTNLQSRIIHTIANIDDWINGFNKNSVLVGFGAGGRGVMTIAALSNAKRFSGILDSNYLSDKCLSPKTRIPIIGQREWSFFKDAYCIVFSFGYFDEIYENLIKVGFIGSRIVSLKNFYPH